MVEAEKQGDALVLHILEPQLQMYVIPQFKAAVAPHLEQKPGHVIFDFEKVEHMDSSAMGAIFHFQRQVRDYKGKFGLIHVSGKVMQIFKITKSDGHIAIFESLAEALKA